MRRAREERTSRVKEAREVSGSWEAANRYLSNKNVISSCFFGIFVFLYFYIFVFVVILYFCIFVFLYFFVFLHFCVVVFLYFCVFVPQHFV